MKILHEFFSSLVKEPKMRSFLAMQTLAETPLRGEDVNLASK
jgi:hypothetical protein